MVVGKMKYKNDRFSKMLKKIIASVELPDDESYFKMINFFYGIPIWQIRAEYWMMNF